jgi:hypothetical protein
LWHDGGMAKKKAPKKPKKPKRDENQMAADLVKKIANRP